MGNVFLGELKTILVDGYTIIGDPGGIKHVANGVVHPATKETITKYHTLVDDPLLQDVRSEDMAKELGRLAKGYGDVKGIDTIRFLDHDGIQRIPKDSAVTYACIVVDYHTPKDNPNRLCITAWGNLITYPGEVTTRQADLTTSTCT